MFIYFNFIWKADTETYLSAGSFPKCQEVRTQSQSHATETKELSATAPQCVLSWNQNRIQTQVLRDAGAPRNTNLCSKQSASGARANEQVSRGKCSLP